MSTSDGVNEVSGVAPTSASGAPYESVVVSTPAMKPPRGRGRIIVGAIVFVVIVALSFVLKPKDPETFSLKASVATTQNVERLRFEVDDLAFGGDTRQTITGIIDVDAGLMQIELSGSAGSTQTAYADLNAHVMYMAGESNGQSLPSGKTWVRFGVSDGTSPDTNRVFDGVALAGQATNIEDLGRETILDGVTAAHFRFDVNTDNALMAAAGAVRSQMGDAAALPDVLKIDVWVDAQNFMRQLSFTLPLADRDVTFSERFTEINPAVEITLPTAEQTIDISELSGN
ncbi:MAG: hypothetical protein NTX77_10700 [Actinobacteria bacterium]|nr:hypothetical protein [Actinomycetota bacterium]